MTRLAQEEDDASISVLEETGRWLGIGLAGFVNTFNPEVIAVGGGASQAGELILKPARKEVQLAPIFLEAVTLVLQLRGQEHSFSPEFASDPEPSSTSYQDQRDGTPS